MVELIGNGDPFRGLFNVVPVILAGVLPALSLAYGQQVLLRRRSRPEFSLRKSEAAELDRALLLYRRAGCRLDQLRDRGRKTGAVWHAMFLVPAEIDQDDADEWEDLQAHRRHLCATIVRLRRLPLQRLRTWIHTLSLRSGLGRALAVHLAVFALLVTALHVSGQAASVQTLNETMAYFGASHPFDQHLFQANAGAACLALVLLPGFYLARRKRLRREFGLEFCLLKELAAMPPDQVADRSVPEIVPDDSTEHWSATLGIAPSASLDEVRDAYKAMIKQNHPDRVQNLSPAIRSFAEAETKRINAAYEEALTRLS